MNTKLRRISGDIFSHDLQDGLNLDGLILQVCYGFNPIDAAWGEYRQNVNPRIDANTMVFAYNAPHVKVPTREQFPSVIFQELEIMASRGCRRLATNPLWYRDDEDGPGRRGGKEADRMMDDAVNAWLNTADNASRVDVIYVVDKYAKGVPTWKEAAMCQDPQSFTDYLNREFRKDVSAWFDTFPMNINAFRPSIVVVTGDGEGLKATDHAATVSFKVASMYACVLTHAAVGVTKEIDALYAMSSVLGFPLVDRFMAGYVDPMTALEVSNLLPTDQEKTIFFDLAHQVYDCVRAAVRAICNADEPQSRAEDYVCSRVAPVFQEVFRTTESYLLAIERYLTGESGCRPAELFPDRLLMN